MADRASAAFHLISNTSRGNTAEDKWFRPSIGKPTSREVKMKIVLYAAIAACLCLTACASLLVDKNTHDYPQPSKDAFLASCMKNSGGKQDACNCMLAKVQERYTYGEMGDLEDKIKAGQPPQEFKDFMTGVAESCVTPRAASNALQ
jgi:hypothetical protein